MKCWLGRAIDIHEKSAPIQIPTEMNKSSRLKITLFDKTLLNGLIVLLVGISHRSGLPRR